MTRNEVLDVLDRLSPLKRKRLDREAVPVHFLKARIAVVLPAERYSPEEQLRLEGKFQHTMTARHGAHAYLDFSPTWNGLATPFKAGFN